MSSIPELSFSLFQLSLEEQSICTGIFAVMSMSRKEAPLLSTVVYAAPFWQAEIISTRPFSLVLVVK